MAKIFLSFHNGLWGINQIPVFYDGLIRALRRNGNDVMVLNSNFFMDPTEREENPLFPNICKEKFLAEIRAFSPDLIIAFNCCIPREILSLGLCPVFLWEADTVLYYNNYEFLKKNGNSIYFGAVTPRSTKDICERLGVRPDRIIHLPFATDLRARPVRQDKNLSFIGTYFLGANMLIDSIDKRTPEENREIVRIFRHIEADPFCMESYLLENFKFPDFLLKYYRSNQIHNYISNTYRVGVLGELCDLGLSIYGNREWAQAAFVSHELALCYNPEAIYSAQQNEELYNSTKISINVSHIQAVSALPWRIRDIMATNSCLVSDDQRDLEIFKQYVEIPVFRDKYEARRICKDLLTNTSRREEIVKASQTAIDKENRFENRFSILENLYGIHLLGEGDGRQIILLPQNYFTVKETTSNILRNMLPGSMKNELKRWRGTALIRKVLMIFPNCLLTAIFSSIAIAKQYFKIEEANSTVELGYTKIGYHNSEKGKGGSLGLALVFIWFSGLLPKRIIRRIYRLINKVAALLEP